jgi:hypothetical protein
MSIEIIENELEIPIIKNHKNLLKQLSKINIKNLIRVVITETTSEKYKIEYCAINKEYNSIFNYKQRLYEDTTKFNTVLLIPTGIGAEIGGHAGDAGPVANLLAEVSNTLILHPNVVNASDINELPENALYVEGSTITRLLMGTIGLQSVLLNNILVILDNHTDEYFTNSSINMVNAARATYGLSCYNVICVKESVKLYTEYSSSGRAVGNIKQIENIFYILDKYDCDAVALSSVINVPHEFHTDYYKYEGEMINPWGGVEAMLTHVISNIYNIPAAHSPMFESKEICELDLNIVDPRMAAEVVSLTFLQCILKGLKRSPKIITDLSKKGILTVENVNCLVIPDGCLGLPVLAALEQGIIVISVKENRNIMKNDLSMLPWKNGQFYNVNNYWEAAGLISSLKSGIVPNSVRRPIDKVKVSII